MASFAKKLHQKFVLTLDKRGAVATVSSFQTSGKLTPEEFVLAGDFLVENFPTWTWVAGRPENLRPHLPADKQFLQTRDVPCLPRSSDATAERVVLPDEDGGWVEAFVSEAVCSSDDLDDAAAKPAAAAAAAAAAPAAAAAAAAAAADDDDDLDDVAGVEEFDYAGPAVADDDAAALPAATGESAIMRTRTYDITITYDTYYATPRVWLFGYDADHRPLTGNAWEADFSPEHLHKTVTVETHPHLGIACPSIHPCKHAEAMLKMISLIVGQGGADTQLDVKYYLLIFLKFIQTMIPNIEYDYTKEFQIA